VGAGAYGLWRERTLPIRELGTVGLIQPNEGFREKWDPRHADSVVGKLVTMSRALEARGPIDLLLWPEAAIPGWLAEMPGWDAQFAALARAGRTPILAGGIHAVRSDVYYNAAFFYDSTGQWRPHPVYGKHYLVPVVERVPFVMRAIETRAGIARAANDGVSEFVDPLGNTYAETGLEQEASVSDRLRTSDVIPLYVRLGDWVGTLCVLATLGFAGVLVVQHWKRNAW